MHSYLWLSNIPLYICTMTLYIPSVIEHLACFHVLLLLPSCVSRVRLCATPQMAARQAPPSLGFSRQEHQSGLPPSYCKQCCNEYWGRWVFFKYGFLMVYTQQWDCWVIWQFYTQIFKNKEYQQCSPDQLYQFAFL